MTFQTERREEIARIIENNPPWTALTKADAIDAVYARGSDNTEVREAQTEIERLRFELQAAKNEIEIADGEIDRLSATEKRIGVVKLLSLLRRENETTGDVFLRGLHSLALPAQPAPTGMREAEKRMREIEQLDRHGFYGRLAREALAALAAPQEQEPKT